MRSDCSRKEFEGAPRPSHRFLRICLENLYEQYNRRAFVHPDPLEFLYPYENPVDREIVGIVASCLAYGRVDQILKSTSKIIEILSPSPSRFLAASDPKILSRHFQGFVHRFAKGEHLLGLLAGLRKGIQAYGSLQRMFLEGFSDTAPTLQDALTAFVNRLLSFSGLPLGHLLPLPQKGSACKRLNLFLRWMVRNDSVDPGGWDQIPLSKLIIPLDTHMFAFARRVGFTARKCADMTTALEITEHFRRICPEDPVRYDFSLTRFGIRNDMNPEDLIFLLGPESHKT